MKKAFKIASISLSIPFLVVLNALAVERIVSTNTEFSTELDAAMPGDEIVLQPGVYQGGHYRANLRQVTIRSADPRNWAIIDGGANALQLTDPVDVTIADLVLRNQTGNGLNIDDGGSYATSANRIVIRNLLVEDIATAGNRDGIKLSGVDNFLIENVTVRNWGSGGSAVDMVGCHHGLIQNSWFVHENGDYSGATLQPKGGSKNITFRANRIELPQSPGRAIQAGGSTGTEFFRFVEGDADYEAHDIVAEGNVVIGGASAFSWVNIDGGVFHHNRVQRPGNWVARILNENQGNSIVDTQNGQFHDNRIVYSDGPPEFSTAVNVGAETLPETFTFARNEWLNLADPTPAGSTPSLPVTEAGGIYGAGISQDTNAPIEWQFPWGRWIVNASPEAGTLDAEPFSAFLRATSADGAVFRPLEADPLVGAWLSSPIEGNSVELSPFSQLILIDPRVCPNCFSVMGDYDGDTQVNAADYWLWRSRFGEPGPVADGNGDGYVDAADYTLWRDALGAQATIVSRPVPEASGLLGVGVVATGGIRIRRAR